MIETNIITPSPNGSGVRLQVLPRPVSTLVCFQGLEITPASVGREKTVEPNVEISLDRFYTFTSHVVGTSGLWLCSYAENNRLKNRSDKADKPKLKLTIKTGTAGTHGHDRMVSPNRLDNTFQVFSLQFSHLFIFRAFLRFQKW